MAMLDNQRVLLYYSLHSGFGSQVFLSHSKKHRVEWSNMGLHLPTSPRFFRPTLRLTFVG